MGRVSTGALTVQTLTVGRETVPPSTRSNSAVLEVQSTANVNPVFVQFRNTNSNSFGTASHQFDALNSSLARVNYASIDMFIISNTAGSHSSAVSINITNAGVTKIPLTVNGNASASAITAVGVNSSQVVVQITCSTGGASGLLVTDGTQAFSVYTSAGNVLFGSTTNVAAQIVTNSVARITVANTGGVSIAASSAGNSLNVTVSGGNGVGISAAAAAGAYLFVAGNGATQGTQGLTIYHDSTGAYLQTNTTDGLFVKTNGTTAFTVSTGQVVKFTNSVGINGANGTTGLSGWGAASGGAVVNNYPGATATLLQTTNAMAQVINQLIAFGIFKV
jgi:hypothetical protein